MPQADAPYRWLFYVNAWPERGTTTLVAERLNESGSVIGRIEYGEVRRDAWGAARWGMVKYAGGTRLPYIAKTWPLNAEGFAGAIASCTKQIDAALGFATWDEIVSTGTGTAPATTDDSVPPRPDDDRTRCANCEGGWGQHNGYRCLGAYDGFRWAPYIPTTWTATYIPDGATIQWSTFSTGR